MFVVRADRTDGSIALNALERLQSVGTRFAGVVLNGVDLQHNQYYYADQGPTFTGPGNFSAA